LDALNATFDGFNGPFNGSNVSLDRFNETLNGSNETLEAFGGRSTPSTRRWMP
jgi:hypothetical protein